MSAFFGIVIATALVSANMFACELGVRGAITCGEAECIPGSGQLVGRAVTRASKLEKQQDWFGVIIDPDILTVDRRAILDLIFVKPLVVEYEVPLKKNAVISAPCLAINWRFNMSVEKGIASLFRESEDAASKNKRDATLAFCRWLRDNNLATGAVYGHDGNPIKIPWLKGLHVGRHQPGTEQAIHGDAF